MKKVTLLFSCALFSVFGFSQIDPVLQSLDELLYGTNRAQAIRMMQENHPDYQLLGGNMQLVDSVTIITDGAKKTVAHELLQYVHPGDRTVAQLIYVDDQLYGKNVSYLFESDQYKAANEKQRELNEILMKSGELKSLMSGSGDEVYYHDADDFPAGEMRIYPVQRNHWDIWELYVGFAFNVPDMNNLSDLDQNKGLWVFITAYRTMDLPVSTKFGFPQLVPPYATMDELASSNGTGAMLPKAKKHPHKQKMDEDASSMSPE